MPSGPPRVVYLVDDDASVRSAMARLMRSNGFDVHEFSTPEEFLADSTEPGPVCVLLDITMPGLAGGEAQAALHLRGGRWPVIAISAREDAAIRETSRQLGARFFLRKPVDGQALLDTIAWIGDTGRVEPGRMPRRGFG